MPVLLIVALGGLVLVLMLVLASRMLNAREIELSQRSIASFIDVRIEVLQRGLQDFVQWENTAVRRLLTERNLAWADHAIGQHFSTYYDASTILILDAENRFVYGWSNGKRVSEFDLGRLGGGIERLTASVREGRDATHVEFAVLAGEGIHFVGVAAVTANGDERAGAPLAHLIIIRKADSSIIRQLAEDRGLGNFTIVTDAKALRDDSYALKDAAGNILGWYTWTLDLPGRDLLGRALPLVLACEMGILLLLTVFLRRASAATQRLEANRAEIAHQREEVAAREETLRAILRYAGDGVLTVEPDGRIVGANIAAGIMFGAEPQMLEGRQLSDLLVDAPSRRWLDLVENGGDSGIIRCGLLRADGRSDEVELRLSRVPRGSGHLILALVRDVGEQRRAEETLNLLTSAMIVVSAEGRVLLSNRSAEALLARCGSLVIENGRLTAPYDSPAVEAALVAACRPGAKPSVLKLRRAGAMTPLTALVTPLDEGGEGKPSRNCVVFLRDPDVRMSVSEPLLRDMYGLTPAEARVVASLVSGRSLQEVALELEISLNTVRNHLKQAYRKTHTSRQSELVSLVLSGPAFSTDLPGAPQAA
jgi:PAS domain S-box-containing protein